MAEDTHEETRAAKVPRLSHRKSKMGCTRCKARKVKCDEVHPRCGPCERHSVSCEYQPPNTPHHPPKSATVSTLPVPTQDSLPLSTPISSVATPPYSGVEPDFLLAESPERRLLELKLMHHYVSAAVATFPAVDDPAVLETWTVYVPRMAFSHSFLPPPPDADAARHRAHTSPDPNSEYAHAHRVYLNAAVQEQRKAVDQLGPSNADAVSLSAAMIIWQSFALYIQEEGLRGNAYTPPLKWLGLSASIAAIVRETRPWINEHSRTNTIIQAKPHLFDWRALFDVKNSAHFHNLLTWHPRSSPSAPTNSATLLLDATAYQNTVSYIGTIFAALSENESPTCLARRFMAPGSLMPDHFRDLLAAMDPRALVIMAHFFSMTKKVGELWWFRGVAEREVTGIASVLPGEWHELMAWPVAMLNGGADRVSNGEGV